MGLNGADFGWNWKKWRAASYGRQL